MRNLLFQSLGLLVALSVAAPAQEREPDLILLDGKVLTVDDDFSIAEAVAVADDRILALGSNEEIRSLAGPAARIIELEGGTVIPGLIDNHSHMTSTAREWYRSVSLEGVLSREAALARIGARAADVGPGEWIFALRGWTPGQFADQPAPLTLEELDQAAPENPVLVVAGMERMGTANSRAMALAVIGNAGGRVEGPEVNRIIQAAGEAESWQAGITKLATDFVRAGLTTVFDPRSGFMGQHTFYQPVEQAYEGGDLPVRFFHTLNGQGARNQSRGADQIAGELQSTEPFEGNDRLGQFGFGEDTLRGLRDTFVQPFQGTPELEADFLAISLAAAEAGWQFHEHSHLEEKISFVIDIYEQVNRTYPIGDLRWTLHHATYLSVDDIPRLNPLGIGVAIHSHGALKVGVSGREAAITAPPPAKALEDAGVLWGLGTDFGGPPLTGFDPFITLGWAVTGETMTGEIVMPETVSRQAALIAHTRSNAYLLHKEAVLGTLEPGKYADLVVLDRDYMTIPAEEIKLIRPVLTMVGGEVVFEADAR